MKLDITRRSRLAVGVMLALDGARTRLKGSELAEMVSSTAGFMPQVLAPLVQKGWVRSEPGPTGGYVLEADLDNISLLDVIEAIEGPIDLEMCMLDEGPCDGPSRCALHDSWTRVRTQLQDELGGLSLREIARNPRHQA